MLFCVRFSVTLWLSLLFKNVVVSWKDEWIVNFAKNALSDTRTEAKLSSTCTPPKLVDNCTWRLPRYIPVRNAAHDLQRIPRVIFQTWKSYTAAGPSQFKSVMSFVEDNPDYEYYLFDDQTMANFMHTFHAEHASLFELILPGAMRADLWRLAVIQKYGGVYFDVDAHSHTPLSQLVWPNASVVTGIGEQGDFHQWALLYTPNHPIITNALQYAWHRVRALHRERAGGSVAQTTGPKAFHAAVKQTLYMHKCSISRLPRNKSTTFIHYLPLHYCSAGVGVLQIFSTDYLGGNVVFKDASTDSEMKSVSMHYSSAQKQHSTLFKADVQGPGSNANIKHQNRSKMKLKSSTEVYNK